MNSDKIEVCGPISNSVTFQKPSLAFSAGMRWTKTICRCSHASQPIRTLLKSHWRHLDFG